MCGAIEIGFDGLDYLKMFYLVGFMQDLDGFIENCLIYIEKNCSESGRFNYFRAGFSGGKNEGGYNILRHAGAIYSVAEYCIEIGVGCPSFLLKATQYLKGFIGGISGRSDLLYIKSYTVKDGQRQVVAKLGGAGLALAAFSLVEKLAPGTTPIEILHGLANFIVFMSNDDGAMFSRYYPEVDLKDDGWHSLYYPGEAAIGLALLSSLDGFEKWLMPAVRIISSLADRRKRQSSVEADHWALLATLEIYKRRHLLGEAVDWPLLVGHGVQITESILGKDCLRRHPQELPRFAWLERNKRTTPLSTRLEGILAFFEMTDAGGEHLRSAILAFASQGVQMLLEAQLTQPELLGGIPEYLPDKKSGSGVGAERSGGIRIDYVQHALSAALGYKKIMKNRLDKLDVVNALHLGMEYMCRAQKQSGNFVYGYDWKKNTEDLSDEPVRQAGSAWGLSLLAGFTGSVNCLNGALRAIRFFESCSRFDQNGGLYVCYPNTQVGATGSVALVALSIIELLRKDSALIDDSTKNALRRQLDGYLLFLRRARRADGRFHARYQHADGRPYGAASPYFDGEAVLSMVKAWKYLGYQEMAEYLTDWVDVDIEINVRKALESEPDSDITKGYYQWVSMTLFELATFESLELDKRKKYGETLIFLADWMLETHKVLSRKRNTAYAFEGLCHALEWARLIGDREKEAYLRKNIEAGLARLMSWQVGHPNACSYIKNSSFPLQAKGGVQNAENESLLRIDVVQHQLHALMLALKYCFQTEFMPLALGGFEPDSSSQQSSSSTGHDEQGDEVIATNELWGVKEVGCLLNGRWLQRPPADARITSLCYLPSYAITGSLVVTTTELQWPVKGGGVRYKDQWADLKEIADQGAVVAIVPRKPESIPEGIGVLMVENTFDALKKLALHRRGVLSAKVVAITGSVGKTSTKQMLCDILSCRGLTHASSHRFNHEAGVPLSVAQTPKNAKFAIFEIGMGPRNSVYPLGLFVSPNVVVITTIDKDHIEYHDSLFSIAETKADLFEAVIRPGAAVIPRDNQFFEYLKSRAESAGIKRIVTFGKDNEDADVRLVDCNLGQNGTDVTFKVMGRMMQAHLPLPGLHQAMNFMAVLATIVALNESVDLAVEHVKALRSLEGRGEIIRLNLDGRELTLIDDSYSANPASVRATLNLLSLHAPAAGARRIAVLGDMKELGKESAKLHEDLLQPIIDSKADILMTIGSDIEVVRNRLSQEILALHFDSVEPIVEWIRGNALDGDVLCVKGSARQGGLGRVVSALKKISVGLKKLG